MVLDDTTVAKEKGAAESAAVSQSETTLRANGHAHLQKQEAVRRIILSFALLFMLTTVGVECGRPWWQSQQHQSMADSGFANVTIGTL